MLGSSFSTSHAVFVVIVSVIYVYPHVCAYGIFDVEVDSEFTLGTRIYAINSSQTPMGVEVICHTRFDDPDELRLIRHNDGGSGYDRPIVTGILPIRLTSGKFSCILGDSFVAESGFIFSLAMRSSFEIRTVRPNQGQPKCAASTGDSVFQGERVQLYCSGMGAMWRDNGDNKRIVDTTASHQELMQYSCGRYRGPAGRWEESCNGDYITVHPYIAVSISPASFPPDSTLPVFVCESTPPRLIHWEIHGTNGNLLDDYYPGEFIAVNTEVKINQTNDGRSTLRILEDMPGRNGIHSVTCFTVETLRNSTTARVAGATSDGSDRAGYIIAIVLLVIAVLSLICVVVFLIIKSRRNSSPVKSDDAAGGTGIALGPSMHQNLAYDYGGGGGTTDTSNGRGNPSTNDPDYTYIEPQAQ